MGNKTVSDAEILDLCFLIDSGRISRREAARRAGISPAAFKKRQLRLNPKSAKSRKELKLSSKQKKFAKLRAQGLSQREAFLKINPGVSNKTAEQSGYAMERNPKVKATIQDLIDQDIPKGYVSRKLREHVDAQDPMVSLRALDQVSRIAGHNAPEKSVSVNLTYTQIQQNILTELLEMRSRIKEALASDPSLGGVFEKVNEKVMEISEDIEGQISRRTKELPQVIDVNPKDNAPPPKERKPKARELLPAPEAKFQPIQGEDLFEERLFRKAERQSRESLPPGENIV